MFTGGFVTSTLSSAPQRTFSLSMWACAKGAQLPQQQRGAQGVIFSPSPAIFLAFRKWDENLLEKTTWRIALDTQEKQPGEIPVGGRGGEEKPHPGEFFQAGPSCGGKGRL